METITYNHPKHGLLKMKEVSRASSQVTGEEYINFEVEGYTDRLFQIKASLIEGEK